jgi:CP family cyanate transporter-like MFS transporter
MLERADSGPDAPGAARHLEDGGVMTSSRGTVLVALALAAFALRPELVGLGPLQEDVRGDLGVSRAAVGVLSALPLVGMGVFALAARPLAARVGARRALGLALWAIVLGAGLRSLAPGYALVVAATVLLGAGLGLGNTLPSMVVKERLRDDMTLGTATYTTGIQVGATLAATLAVPLAGIAGGWRGSLAVLALIAVAAAVCWPLLVPPSPPPAPGDGVGTGARPIAPAAPPPPPPRLRLRLAALLACMSCVYYGTIAWLASDLVDAGWSTAAAGVALGVLSAAGIASTVAFGALGDRVGTRTGWIAASMACLLVGLVGVTALPALGLVWAVVFGAGNGAGFGATMTLPLDLVDDPATVVAITGPMLLGGYVVGAAAPPAIGLLRDLTGGFDAGFLVLAGLAAVALALASSRVLRPHHVS